MKKILISLLIGLAIGAALVRQYMPRVETKTEQKVVTQTKIKIVERIVQHPDGTTETERTTEDNSQQTSSDKSTVKASQQPQYMLTLGAGTQLIRLQPIYSASVARRLAGPIYGGAYGRTDGEFGLTVGLEF